MHRLTPVSQLIIVKLILTQSGWVVLTPWGDSIVGTSVNLKLDYQVEEMFFGIIHKPKHLSSLGLQ